MPDNKGMARIRLGPTGPHNTLALLVGRDSELRPDEFAELAERMQAAADEWYDKKFNGVNSFNIPREEGQPDAEKT